MNETNYNETTNDAGAQEIIGHDGGEMMFRGGMVPYSTECTQDDSTQYTFTIGGGETPLRIRTGSRTMRMQKCSTPDLVTEFFLYVFIRRN